LVVDTLPPSPYAALKGQAEKVWAVRMRARRLAAVRVVQAVMVRGKRAAAVKGRRMSQKQSWMGRIEASRASQSSNLKMTGKACEHRVVTVAMLDVTILSSSAVFPVECSFFLSTPACSLSALKKRLAEAQARKRQKVESEDGGPEDSQGVSRGSSVAPAVPIEADRILTEEDFERIRWVT
jgi:hypothetical protein